MASKRTNGADSPTNHGSMRVLVDRDEWVALLALKELVAARESEGDRLAARNRDLLATCEAQAKRLVELDLLMQHRERVEGVQRGFIEALRADRPGVATLEELSEFWRKWTSNTQNHAKNGTEKREEIARLEPDLFRTWRIWIRDAGKVSRSFAVSGTRAEVEASQPATPAALQDHAVAQLRDQVSAMSARLQEMEGEVNAYKNQRKDKGIR